MRTGHVREVTGEKNHHFPQYILCCQVHFAPQELFVFFEAQVITAMTTPLTFPSMPHFTAGFEALSQVPFPKIIQQNESSSR